MIIIHVTVFHCSVHESHETNSPEASRKNQQTQFCLTVFVHNLLVVNNGTVCWAGGGPATDTIFVQIQSVNLRSAVRWNMTI